MKKAQSDASSFVDPSRIFACSNFTLCFYYKTRYTISLQLFPFVICKKLLTVQNAMYRYQYGI